MKDEISPLERRFIEEVLRPVIKTEFSRPQTTELYTLTGYSETLNFPDLLRKLRNWYQASGGRDWNEVVYQSDRPEPRKDFKRPKKSAFPTDI